MKPEKHEDYESGMIDFDNPVSSTKLNHSFILSLQINDIRKAFTIGNRQIFINAVEGLFILLLNDANEDKVFMEEYAKIEIERKNMIEKTDPQYVENVKETAAYERAVDLWKALTLMMGRKGILPVDDVAEYAMDDEIDEKDF